MDIRLDQLSSWLKIVLEDQHFAIAVASADASFRRYFRVTINGQSFIAMDAPPDREDSEPFVRISTLLNKLGVHTPEIYAKDLALGFILLEDLGSTDYLDLLRDENKADGLYSDAIDALIKIQKADLNSIENQIKNQASTGQEIANYSEEKLREEMELFPAWYLTRHLQGKLNTSNQLSDQQRRVWENTKSLLCKICAEQPQAMVHRDFHSRNLMVTTQNNPGVIDFQDLVIGPISYDLASIFKDCYIEWPRARQLVWLRAYYDRLTEPTFEFSQLIIWYDLTGLQRHLKVLGIFCRLNYRDGKSGYLNDLPLVAKYCLEVLDIYAADLPELKAFKDEFSSSIQASL